MEEQHGNLAVPQRFVVGPDARDVLKGDRAVAIAEPPKKKPRRRGGAGAVPNPVGDPLFDALRAKRAALAKENSVPAYIIFHDSVLRAMASERPGTLSVLGGLQGVGEKKLESWGEHFLEVIREFESG